jgi:hypothetical protein
METVGGMEFHNQRRALAKLLHSPLSSGPFKYVKSGDDGGLEVDGVARCNGDRLIALLTYVAPPPLLTKKGKPRVRQPPPHQDETDEFYAAQCVHYGLPRGSQKSRIKAATKDALLALAKANGGVFIVPAAVAEVEAKLAREFQVQKVEYLAKMAVINAKEEAAEKQAQNKRRRDEDELLSIIAKKPKKGDEVVSALQMSDMHIMRDMLQPGNRNSRRRSPMSPRSL